MLQIAVIGYGYWGPNLVRNFAWSEGCEVKYVCDINPNRLTKIRYQFPNVGEVTSDFSKVIHDPDIDAVAIATPVHSHFDLAKQALAAGKHVLLEKPMTDKMQDAEILCKLADDKNLILMVDHTFLFTGAVRKIKELTDSGSIGNIYYFDSIRVNLGLFQRDVNVIWDLAAHDLSILRYVLDKQPVSISATGVSHLGSDLENLAYVSVFYSDSTMAHFHVNWLSPIKVRQIMIGGADKMIVYDDMENVEKVKVYDKGIDLKDSSKSQLYETLIQYRTGDMYAPKLDNKEALKLECEYFLDSIKASKRPVNDGRFGLQVVSMLEAAQKSIKQKGKIVEINSRC